MISNFMKHLRQEWHLEPFFEKKYVAYLSDIMSFYCLLILKGTITNQPLYLTYERESERIYESLEREIHLSDARTKPGRYFNFKDTARFYEREFHYDFSYSLRQTREELANLYDSTPKRVSSALYGAHDPRHVFKLQPVPKRHPRFFASAAPSEGGAKTTTLALSLK